LPIIAYWSALRSNENEIHGHSLEGIMTNQILTLDELKRRSFEEVLQGVVEQGLALTVRLPGGEQVVIEPKPRLKPLPVLEGYVPEGWKDAIYEPT